MQPVEGLSTGAKDLYRLYVPTSCSLTDDTFVLYISPLPYPSERLTHIKLGRTKQRYIGILKKNE